MSDGSGGTSPPPPPPGGPPPPPPPPGGSVPPPPPGYAPAPSLPPSSSPSAPSSSRAGLIIGLIVAALAVIGVAVFFLTRDDDDGDASDPVETAVDETLPEGDIPPPEDEPEGLGDDSELDDLAERCYDGSMEACDDLYFDSDVGSDYERYGDTCAGRQEPGTGRRCAVVFVD